MSSQEEVLHQPILNSDDPEPVRSSSSSHALDTRLEKVLSSTHLLFFNRLWLASCIELRLLLRLALPAVMVYLINNFMSLSTRVFSGHLGNLEFAAASLGNSGIQLLTYGLMVRTYLYIYLYPVQVHESKGSD